MSAPPVPPTTAAALPDLPVHELLALEAVARLGSIQAAADALHITPSGVSHRVANLEKRVGLALLRRHGRGIALTDAAHDYVGAVRPALAQLSRASAALREQQQRTIRIATAAAVGAAWLLPRLDRFAALRPDARYAVRTVATFDESPADQWDLMIHYGDHARRGSVRHELFRERLIRVCAPALRAAADSGTPALPLLRLTQLAQRAREGDQACDGGAARVVFDDALSMLEAAAAGVGVALSTETAAGPYLKSGRLVATQHPPVDGDAYAIDLSEAGQLKPLARACCDWLLAHATALG